MRASQSPTPSVCYSSLRICSPPTHVVWKLIISPTKYQYKYLTSRKLNNAVYLHGRSPSASSVQCSGSEHPPRSVPSQVRYAKCFLLRQVLFPSALDAFLVFCCHPGALQSGAQRGVIGE
jgi:hypothetical protein